MKAMYWLSASTSDSNIPRLPIMSRSHSPMSSGMSRTVRMMSSTPPRTKSTRSFAHCGNPDMRLSIALTIRLWKRSPAVSAMSMMSRSMGRVGIMAISHLL